jgi:hypothetical protein
MNVGRAFERETEREKLAGWYIKQNNIPNDEKRIMEKSLKYNLWKSILCLMAVYFVFTCIWAFVFCQLDPYEKATGYRLGGAKTFAGIVQEDGISVLVKDPNKGQTSTYLLTELGLNEQEYKYRDEIECFFLKNEDGSEEKYTLAAALPMSQSNHLKHVFDLAFFVGYVSVLVICVAGFFIKRRKYTSWYPEFYWRMEKFCSDYGVYRMYPDQDTDTVDVFIRYGDEHPQEFARNFPLTRLTKAEEREHKKQIITAVLIAFCVWLIIISGVYVVVTIQSIHDERVNDARRAAVKLELDTSLSNGMEPLGASSDYYNIADMVERMEASFPEEDIYYNLIVSKEYISFVYTTEKKTNVYLDRYVPVEGNVGETGLEYTLEISMVSDAIQPDDILTNYTGVLK